MTNTEAPYSVTMRTGAGYDASLVTVRGDSAAELLVNLQELTEANVPDTVLDIQSILQAASVVAEVTSAPAAAAPAAAPAGEMRLCSHGKRVMKTGQSAKGKWTGWFCALPKGSAGACDPIWD